MKEVEKERSWYKTTPERGQIWARQDSNLRPTGYEPAALTAELRALKTDKAGNGIRTRNNTLEG